MPLSKGTSEKTFKKNVAEMVKAGYPQKQALAAAYQQKRASAKDEGCPLRALQAFLKDCAKN